MKARKNVPASVRQRLLDLSRERAEEFGLMLRRYGLERFLYRLSLSDHRDQFILKGAMLFQVWTLVPHRPTRDLDLLGRGDPSLERCLKSLRSVCSIQFPEDGLIFLPESARAERIQEGQEYEGIRVRLVCRLEQARIPLQIDVGFGDIVMPPPALVTFPTLLELPAPRVRAYPREAVVSEKLEAILHFGMSNSRMRDFFDLWLLSAEFEFEGSTLAEAIRATFTKRERSADSKDLVKLLGQLAADPGKEVQWKAFLRISKVSDAGEWPAALSVLRDFLRSPMDWAGSERAGNAHWPAGGPWRF